MQVASRIGRETLVQIVGFGVQLGERILLAGLLVRMWGVDDFAAWSLAVSAAGLLALFDFGINLYFANRVLFLVQQGDRAGAQRMVAAGNLLMALASAIGLIAVAIGFWFYLDGGVRIGSQSRGDLWLAAMLLAGFTFLRAAMAIQMSVYRAHEQFGRQSMLFILSDILRIVATVAVVLAGGSLLMAAGAYFLAGLLYTFWLLLIEVPRRFPDFPPRVALFRSGERRQAAGLSLGFWIQSAPSTGLTYVPVLLLTGVGSPVIVAQFVLMRTLANFMRAALQPFSTVFGQESARRHAIGDRAGEASTYREGAFLLASLGAVPAGLLLGAGDLLFTVWTAQPTLFDQLMLAVAIAPVLLLPSLMMAQAHLSTINAPWPIAVGRMLQVALSLGCYLVLPIANPGLRMFVALAVGELLGLMFVLTRRVASTICDTGWAFHAEIAARMSGTLALTYLASLLGTSLDAGLLIDTAGGVIAGAAGGVVGIALLGLTVKRRRAVTAALVGRFSRRA